MPADHTRCGYRKAEKKNKTKQNRTEQNKTKQKKLVLLSLFFNSYRPYFNLP